MASNRSVNDVADLERDHDGYDHFECQFNVHDGMFSLKITLVADVHTVLLLVIGAIACRYAAKQCDNLDSLPRQDRTELFVISFYAIIALVLSYSAFVLWRRTDFYSGAGFAGSVVNASFAFGDMVRAIRYRRQRKELAF